MKILGVETSSLSISSFLFQYVFNGDILDDWMFKVGEVTSLSTLKLYCIFATDDVL